jgi:hypothetical protein
VVYPLLSSPLAPARPASLANPTAGSVRGEPGQASRETFVPLPKAHGRKLFSEGSQFIQNSCGLGTDLAGERLWNAHHDLRYTLLYQKRTEIPR